MRLWAEAWASGSVPDEAVEIWIRGFVKPLNKKSGEGVRPITMFETLLKVATGLALDVSKSSIMRAVGDFQYGTLMASGQNDPQPPFPSRCTSTPCFCGH